MACSIRVKPGNLRSRPSPSVRGGPARRHGNLPRRRCTRRSGGANLLNCNVVCHIPIETNSAAAAQRETTMWSKARDLSTSRRVIHSFCGQTTPRWHIRVIWNRLHLASSRKHPAAESGRIRANLSATFARAHLAERRIPRAHERPSRLRSSLPVSRSRQTLTRTPPPVITTGVPHQRKNTQKLHCVAFPQASQ